MRGAEAPSKPAAMKPKSWDKSVEDAQRMLGLRADGLPGPSTARVAFGAKARLVSLRGHNRRYQRSALKRFLGWHNRRWVEGKLNDRMLATV